VVIRGARADNETELVPAVRNAVSSAADASSPPYGAETRLRATTAATLIAKLNDAGVRYCHFKSNAEVAAGVEARTDLDVLCDGRDVGLLEGILARRGFKRLPAHPSRRYPGVEDFFGVDDETGRLVHLHVHYRLIAGARFFKNYHLPWEREFLDRRVLDEPTGVYVADPALEWLLLACRAALKIRWRDWARAATGSGRGGSGGLRREHHWLATRVDRAAPRGDASRLLGPPAADLVAAVIADDLAFRRLRALRRELLRSPGVPRAHGSIGALRLRWTREVRWIVGTINRRYLHRPFPYARSGSAGGVTIAVIGSDGAGKSTVAAALHTWLAGKVDVVPVYLGSGQGRSSILRSPLKLALQLVRRPPTERRLGPEERRTRDITLARAVWAVALAREKRSKLRTVVRARERGFVVICDRYPQTQIGGVNDGPLLWQWTESPSRVRRSLAQWERRIYGAAAATSPDLVVRLLVSPETAGARRPDDDPRELAFRTQLVRGLDFGGSRYGVVDVDADADLDTVVLDVKRRVWPAI